MSILSRESMIRKRSTNLRETVESKLRWTWTLTRNMRSNLSPLRWNKQKHTRYRMNQYESGSKGRSIKLITSRPRSLWRACRCPCHTAESVCYSRPSGRIRRISGRRSSRWSRQTVFRVYRWLDGWGINANKQSDLRMGLRRRYERCVNTVGKRGCWLH